MSTRNIVGNVPEPDELYGREEFIEHLWRQIQGNNILLLAPRRFGKTGVMRHVLQKPHGGYWPVYFDLEDVDSPAEFVWQVTRTLLSNDRVREFLNGARSLPGKLREWVKENFDELEFDGAKIKFKDAVRDNWRDIARRLLLEMEKFDNTVIFIFDELPAMLETVQAKHGEDAARDFMAWLRVVRLQQKDQLRRHRFVVGGSIGIDLILRRLNSVDKLNDFERLYVEPLQKEVAKQLVGDLAETMHVDLSAELSDRILELIGPPVPYFIHMLFSQLGQLPAAKRQPLEAGTLDRVYRHRVLGPTCKHYFDHYRERLKRYGKSGEKSAIAILSTVAERERVSESALYDVYKKAKGRGASELGFSELLADLECDWYLVLDPHTNEFFFMVDVIRDWWRRWHRAPKGRRA